jgi:Domain of unknown function (DUF5655)
VKLGQSRSRRSNHRLRLTPFYHSTEISSSKHLTPAPYGNHAADSIPATTLAQFLAARDTFEEDPKKTSIHLNRRTAFAGIATRKDSLLLTIKASADNPSPRIRKHEKVSANRWHLEVLLTTPDDVDAELKKWLEAAYELAA